MNTADKNFSLIRKKAPELLAPAGDFACFTGAVNASADAVYLSGEKFGARAYATNFSKEEILDAISYAHLHDAKVYLTVNTKTKSKEGSQLYSYLLPLYENGLDGVIVQDFGVFEYIRNVFPNLPLHVSTQMCVSSYMGAKYLKEKGASRIVPARELSLDEIKEINELGIETECFIHGSMCYSYSGECLFSSFLGGRSGNRGRCAGPCRQPYSLKKGREEQYLLSLKDMCTIAFLPKLIDAGITSFKIEGRMKSPAYAAGVTRIYRKYIDSYLANPDAPYRVSKEDLEELKHLYLRSELQTGYYDKYSDPSMVSVSSPSYNKTDEELSARLIDSYCRNKVAKKIPLKISLKVGENAAISCKDPYSGKDISISGAEVLKAEKAPLKEEDIRKRFAKSSLGYFAFDISELNLDSDAFLPVGALNELRRAGEAALVERLNQSFLRTALEDIEGFWEGVKDDSADGKKEDIQFKVFCENKDVFLKLVNDVKSVDHSVLRFVVPSEWMDDTSVTDIIRNKSGIHFFISLPWVMRSPNFENLKRRTKLCETISNIDGYYVNQIDSLAFLKELNVKKPILGDYALYIANPGVKRFLGDDITAFTADLELNFEEWKAFGKKYGEIMLYGKVPLMQTANCVKKTLGKCDRSAGFFALFDRTKTAFTISTHCYEKLCYNTIYNSVPISLHKQWKELMSEKIRDFQIRFTDESYEECKEILALFMKLSDGGECENVPYEFTKGHFIKSVL